MDESSRLIGIGVAILAVGLLVGYSIGRSGTRKARKRADRRVSAERKETSDAKARLARCKQQLSKPSQGADQRTAQRTQAVLRLTQAELAVRAENAGIARQRIAEATALLKQLAGSAATALAATLRGLAGQLEKLRESSLRLDLRDPQVLGRLAASLADLRKRVSYLPLSPVAAPMK